MNMRAFGWRRGVLPTVGLFLSFCAIATAQPLISGINNSEPPRSGRLVITGSGFGAGGDVFIDGLASWTTAWSDGRVVAYVPEAATLGPASVFLSVQGQTSNSVPLTVTARQPEGRVRWSFEADADSLFWRPALAPDGTIYIHDSGGLLYALSPDGGLLWIQRVTGFPYVPPSAGPDGALYVGSLSTVYRVSPEGDIDWVFRDPQSGDIQVAPTIGPDGLLYGAYSVGSGVFALDPATGGLVWSNIGNPRISDKGNLGTEMRFGAVGPGLPKDQLYFHMNGGAGLYAFSLGGNQLFTRGLAGNNAHEPAVGSDGTIYAPRSLGFRVVALDPVFGAVLWEYDGGWATGVVDVEIGPGPDDILYFVGGASLLEAFDPHSLRRLWRKSVQAYLGVPSISPDGSTLVVGGDPGSVGGGVVKGFNARNGKELWTVTLPSAPYPGFRSYPVHHARITPDNATAYVSTVTGEDLPLVTDKGTYLLAIDLGSQGGGGGRGKPPKKQ